MDHLAQGEPGSLDPACGKPNNPDPACWTKQVWYLWHLEMCQTYGPMGWVSWGQFMGQIRPMDPFPPPPTPLPCKRQYLFWDLHCMQYVSESGWGGHTWSVLNGGCKQHGPPATGITCRTDPRVGTMLQVASALSRVLPVAPFPVTWGSVLHTALLAAGSGLSRVTSALVGLGPALHSAPVDAMCSAGSGLAGADAECSIHSGPYLWGCAGSSQPRDSMGLCRPDPAYTPCLTHPR